MKHKYHGYSYPTILSKGPLGWLWKKIFCKRGWHLWDEVLGTGADTEDGWEHSMVCDVCQKTIIIDDAMAD